MSTTDVAKIIVEVTPKPVWIAVGDIVCGIVLAVIFLAITDGITLSLKQPYFALPNANIYGLPAYAACALVLLASLAVAFVITYVLVKAFDERYDDALTPLRKSLLGEWRLKATTSNGSPAWTGRARFVIDDLKKLRIELTLPESDLYRGLPVNVVDISLNPRAEPMTITYFCSMRFVRRQDNGIDIREFFVRMERKRIDNLEELNGSWHELTNSGTGAISFERLAA
jgi:hypothetical protein